MEDRVAVENVLVKATKKHLMIYDDTFTLETLSICIYLFKILCLMLCAEYLIFVDRL